MARRTISFYATVKTYMPLWELHGFADNAVAAGDAFRRGDLAAVPAAISDEMVEAYCAAGPLDKVRARVEATAERADGLFLTPPTYFISPEELSEFQNRIIDAFGPGRLTAPRRTATAEVLARVRAIPAGFVGTYGDVSPGAPRFAGASSSGRRARSALVAGRPRRWLARQGRAGSEASERRGCRSVAGGERASPVPSRRTSFADADVRP